MIVFDHVSKVYSNGTVGLDDVNLTIQDGEFVAIIGRSGAGKSTLLRAVNRMHRITAGTLTVNGTDVSTLSGKALRQFRRGIGMVFQSFNLVTRTSVIKNVLSACVPDMPFWRVLLGAFRKEDKLKALESLDKVGILDKAYMRADQLSGGQQQRVAIARSLVSSDELIVLDEPITNLDAKLREEMILEIQMIQQNIGTTIIYITHDQEAALQLCDRIAIMQPDGQICQIGSDEEIIRRPANRFVYSFIGVSNFLPVTEKGGKVCLALGGEPVLFDAPPQGYVSGKKNVMGVRPMDIVFDAKSPIRATIRRDTFLGNQYDYQVELMGRELRVERNALDVLADPTRYEAGQEVGLKFLNVKFYEEEAKA